MTTKDKRPAPKLVSMPVLFTTEQIDSILKQFPDTAVIKRSDIYISVTAPVGPKVLSAVFIACGRWHVRALEGMITPKAKP